MQSPESRFLSIFLLQSDRSEGIRASTYRLEARLSPLTAGWTHRGIPDESPARRRRTEPRLARAILQALTIADSIENRKATWKR
jgi:hypothetical protein